MRLDFLTDVMLKVTPAACRPGLIHVLLLAVLEVESSDPCICGQSKRKRIVRIQVQHTLDEENTIGYFVLQV